jgi:hypothetical protein
MAGYRPQFRSEGAETVAQRGAAEGLNRPDEVYHQNGTENVILL